MKASSEEIAQHTHQVQDHEAEQLTLYTKVEEFASQPDLFDEPNTQETEDSSIAVHKHGDQK